MYGFEWWSYLKGSCDECVIELLMAEPGGLQE